jgi:biopolymer transport protein ExbD
MKLESTIRVRPDFLYLAPLLNVVLLLMVFFLVNSNLVVRSGMRVDLPVSGSSVKVSEHAHVVTITGDAEPRVLLNNREISVGDLATDLVELKKESRDVAVNADSHAPAGMLLRVWNEVLKAGCYPKMITRSEED